MTKQMKIQSVEISRFDLMSVVKCFSSGNSIMFITKEQRLIGAVTEGDMKRYFRERKHALNIEIINYNIRYVVDSGDSDEVLQKADVIFRENLKIQNIPVVDNKGMLLYQIDRKETIGFEQVMDALAQINIFGAFPVFLSCEQTKYIVITGGKNSVLTYVANWFERHVSALMQGNGATISTLRNPTDFTSVSKGSVIICLSDIVFYYLRMLPSKDVKILLLKEIYQYYCYKELQKIRVETITNYFKLFECDKICIPNSNVLIDQFMDKVKQCGIAIVDKKEKLDIDMLQTDILFGFDNGMDLEGISLRQLYLFLQLLQEYYDITKRFVERKDYIQEYISCLKVLLDEGFKVHIESYTQLSNSIYQKLQRMEDEGIVRLGEKEYIRLKEKGVTTLSSFDVLETKLAKVCYNQMKQFYNNVYFRGYKRPHIEYTYFARQTRVNYLENQKDCFLPDFIEKIYGQKNYPVSKLISDMNDCSVYKVNTGYVKYKSNYQSEFFNTDTYGCRVTVGSPRNYTGTIWLLGSCRFNGYAVEDCDTVASILQEKINQSGIYYRVVDLSLGSGQFWDQINRILEMQVKNHDIIIIESLAVWSKNDDHAILMDMDKFLEQLAWGEYWDHPLHCGVKGYTIMAEQLYKK